VLVRILATSFINNPDFPNFEVPTIAQRALSLFLPVQEITLRDVECVHRLPAKYSPWREDVEISE
jgi:hypothetical protein